MVTEAVTLCDVVTVSARLMGQASRPDAEYSIFCDEATSQMAKSHRTVKVSPYVIEAVNVLYRGCHRT